MTLVELLVVVSIMVMLVAVSVPTFKPMLESQRSAAGARAVSMALQRARAKAVYEKKRYGVEFVRFHDGNAPNLSLQMRLVRPGKNFVEFKDENGDEIRVRVESGTIKLCQFNSGSWAWEEVAGSDTLQKWDDNIEKGSEIQLGRQGRSYKLQNGSNRQLEAPYSNLNLPEVDLGGGEFSALELRVLQSRENDKGMTTALSPVVVLPRGTVVDLQFSSFDNPDEAGYCSFSSFNPLSRGVGVMFSPAGHVDHCYYYGDDGKYRFIRPHGGLFYFCIGEWDRQGTAPDGSSLAEDKDNNLTTASNFWVTVNPRTGQVRSAEMGAIPSDTVKAWKNSPTEAALKTMTAPARKYATEHYTDIGGF